MGLLGGVARTAVVAGTATAVSNRVSRRQGRRWAAQEQQAYDQQAYQQPGYGQPVYAPPADEEPADDDMSSKLDQLKQLGELKAQGVLTEAEFERQKSRILGT
jgi:Short C-terminal domain